jgi:hypothetical protein
LGLTLTVSIMVIHLDRIESPTGRVHLDTKFSMISEVVRIASNGLTVGAERRHRSRHRVNVYRCQDLHEQLILWVVCSNCLSECGQHPADPRYGDVRFPHIDLWRAVSLRS